MPQVYNKNLIQYYFNNDSPENPRSDGGFITIAVQVNPILFDNPDSQGCITIWHIKNTIPEKGDGKDRALPPVGPTPVFAGELKMTFANDSVYTDTQPTPGKKPPKAAIHVPYIMLNASYQGLRMAPIFWKVVCETAQANSYRILNEWNTAKAAQQAAPKQGLTRWVSPEPPMSLVVVDMPDRTIRDYWDKVGFNFLASQQELAWSIDAQSQADMMAVVTGTATPQVMARISPMLTIPPGQIQGAVDYLAGLAADGIKRGGWYETKAPV